eukprot:scaffold10372_cov32-Tisochrysis_lutea.AAC.2
MPQLRSYSYLEIDASMCPFPFSSLEGILAHLRKKHTPEQLKEMLPDPFPFEDARRLFREAEVVDVSTCSFKWGEPDVEGLKR